MALAARLFAPHYAEAVERRCGPRLAPLHIKPDGASETLGDLEPGEAFALLDISGGWAWGYRLSDHMVGYVPAGALDA